MSKACIRIATGRSPIVGSNHRNPHLSIKHIYSESTAAAPSPDFSAKRRRRRRRSKIKMGIWACLGVISPFPFYYFLWNNPQSWVDLCGRGRDPCRVMALVSHFLKLAQFIALFSVSTLSWPPPLYFWPLFLFGQFLNFRSGALLLLLYLCGCLWEYGCVWSVFLGFWILREPF